MLLAEKIIEGKDAILTQNWGCTESVAEQLTKISESQIMEIEEFIVEDLVSIELNVSSSETPTPIYNSSQLIINGSTMYSLTTFVASR